MRCSWSDAVRSALTPRLLIALAASAALHAVLVAALEPRSGSGAGPADAISAFLVSEAAAQQKPAPQPAAGSARAPRYYRTSELDVVPGIMTRVVPEYPQLARSSGKVVIRLFIDERGTVERVAVLRSEPKGYFEASAQRAFLAARFTPAMKAGKPVKAQVTLQVDYHYPR